MAKKVFVSGCYDLLHSGHVEFFKQASQYGDLYVGIGSDATIEQLKHHKTMFPEEERLFMVKSIRYVTDAFINRGEGMLDFVPTVDMIKPDILVVNSDGGNSDKAAFCAERGIEYVVLERVPHEGLAARSSTSIKATLAPKTHAADSKAADSGAHAAKEASSGAPKSCQVPTRLDLAGTWIDQPYVSCHKPGWALTISLNPTFEIRDRCGLSTSTRNNIKRIWPYKLPKMDPETLARLVFCFENHPEREGGHISGAQDSIGICIPGLARHYYDNHFWPEKIEFCQDEKVLSWLESHICLIPLEPRRPGLSVVAGSDITPEKVESLTLAADLCWNAILACDLEAFANAYQASFEAQIAMFPAMVDPVVNGTICEEASVVPHIRHWADQQGVLAYKLAGAGGGGYLALVVSDLSAFIAEHSEAIPISIRRA